MGTDQEKPWAIPYWHQQGVRVVLFAFLFLRWQVAGKQWPECAAHHVGNSSGDGGEFGEAVACLGCKELTCSLNNSSLQLALLNLRHHMALSDTRGSSYLQRQEAEDGRRCRLGSQGFHGVPR